MFCLAKFAVLIVLSRVFYNVIIEYIESLGHFILAPIPFIALSENALPQMHCYISGVFSLLTHYLSGKQHEHHSAQIIPTSPTGSRTDYCMFSLFIS